MNARKDQTFEMWDSRSEAVIDQQWQWCSRVGSLAKSGATSRENFAFISGYGLARLNEDDRRLQVYGYMRCGQHVY